MKNEWLEDFRNELYTLGRVIWDYQNDVPGAIFDVCTELERVAKGVVKAWSGLVLSSETPGVLAAYCVSHMTLRDVVTKNGEVYEVDGSSRIDKIDLTTQDAYAYAVANMTEYLRNRHKPKA